MKPIAYDLYCGLGGWAEGFLSEGYRVIGFDIERHDYGTGGYPGELILRDVLSIHGSELKDATVIVASPPCQAYSYRAMPWSRAKALPPPDNSLFEACFRIQREASESAGRKIPLIVENVRGAQKWVGYARWHFGSYFLWGDVPALMPISRPVKMRGISFSNFRKTGEISPHWRMKKFSLEFQGDGLKGVGRVYARDGAAHTRHLTNPAEHFRMEESGLKQPMGKADAWFDGGAASFASNSLKRAAASAMLAKIPFPLAQHIARCFKEAL